MIVADPPWRFGDALGTRGADDKYRSMTLGEIKRFELPPIEHDCILFLWRVSSMQEEAFEVARAWGFDPTKGELVWRKMTSSGKEHFGMGRVFRGAHESCIVAKRGKPQQAKRRDVRSILSAPVPRGEDGKVIHSAKPDEFFELIASMFDGPRASIFERRQRVGFQCYGDEMPEGEQPCMSHLDTRVGARL